jgi:hypothetical protein
VLLLKAFLTFSNSFSSVFADIEDPPDLGV